MNRKVSVVAALAVCFAFYGCSDGSDGSFSVEPEGIDALPGQFDDDDNPGTSDVVKHDADDPEPEVNENDNPDDSDDPGDDPDEPEDPEIPDNPVIPIVPDNPDNPDNPPEPPVNPPVVDKCENVSCGEHGDCNAETGTCDCKDDYTGDNCEIAPVVDKCENVSCGEHGDCNAETGTCDCKDDYTGYHCEIAPETGECSSANEGKTCIGQGGHVCGQFICQNKQCVEVAVKDGRVCRNAANACDVADKCNGSSLDCPADAKAADGTSCGTSTHVCGVKVCKAGACTEAPITDGRVCRNAAGVCDIADKCNGSSLDCPADAKQPKTYVCNQKSGSCDVAAYCDGSSNGCPAKTFTVKNSCECPTRAKGPTAASQMVPMDHGGYLLRSRDWTNFENYINTLKKNLKVVSLQNLSYNREMQPFSADLAKKYESKKEKGADSNFKPMPYTTWVGYQKGWYWNDDDVTVNYWIPQGMTVGEVDGFKVAIVAWHYTDNKRVRISIINTTNLNTTPKYRHVMLVQPTSDGSFKDIQNHGGGLAFVWPYLYEADSASSKGFRVFDLRNIMTVSTDDKCKDVTGKSGSLYCANKAKYILPQIGSYYSNADSVGTASSCKMTFSYISYDEGEGPHILAGEYVKDEFHGRMVRWPLASSGKLKTIKVKNTDGKEISVAQPDAAWYSGERNLQGAISSKIDGTLKFILTSTRNAGAINITNTSKYGKLLKAPNDWCYRPEGIAITGNQLWISTEGNENPRAVFYCDLRTVLSKMQ